jgi:hypothetical protein
MRYRRFHRDPFGEDHEIAALPCIISGLTWVRRGSESEWGSATRRRAFAADLLQVQQRLTDTSILSCYTAELARVLPVGEA